MPNSNKNEVLNYYIDKVNESDLSDQQKQGICKAIKAIAEQFYKAGVKAGYMKILIDYRDGNIEIATSKPRELNLAIQKAQEGTLMPGTDLAPRIGPGIDWNT